jgi:hypothetical protein
LSITGFKNFLMRKQHQHQERCNGQDHPGVHRKQHQHQDHKDDELGGQLQEVQDQRVDVVDVAGDVALDHRGVGVEVVLVGPLHEVDHHAIRGPELVPVDEVQQHLLLKVQVEVLDEEHHHDGAHHQQGELLGALHVKEFVDVPHVVAVLRDRLRVDDHLQDGDDQGDAQGLQHGADQHDKHQADHHLFLAAVQEEVEFFPYLLHRFCPVERGFSPERRFSAVKGVFQP